MIPGDGDRRHGTESGYSRHGCRCEECRAARASYLRDYCLAHPERYEKNQARIAGHRADLNPLHLVLQTPSENQRNGATGRRTSCVNGHPYDETNTYWRANGQRDCKTCKRYRNRRYYRRGAA